MPVSIRKVFRGAPFIIAQLCSRLHIFRLSVAYPTLNFGPGVFLAHNSGVLVTDGGSISLGAGASLEPHARVEAKGGRIDIGDGGFIGQGSIIVACENISIGPNALIGEYVTIRDQDHEFESGKPTAESGLRTSPIYIGENVWVGAKATITRGVSIGDNAVVGANAVVTRSVPENAVVGGVPAKILRFHRDCEPIPD
jgi:carbonic anhydrase/acetyltransferase-like protein (isoleucine patch superfamily)